MSQKLTPVVPVDPGDLPAIGRFLRSIISDQEFMGYEYAPMEDYFQLFDARKHQSCTGSLYSSFVYGYFLIIKILIFDKIAGILPNLAFYCQ